MHKAVSNWPDRVLRRLPKSLDQRIAVDTRFLPPGRRGCCGLRGALRRAFAPQVDGHTTNYVPLDGTIDVTATYGGSGNLYTVGEYGDFILRFEFRFLTEGVNNGIGIRTPMGVDAAFHGMEIQILDHDAPIYKDISDYQQHGSVYGVIPAERVKFGELGEWNTEEIRAVGDRITVTVNGRVILDGNIREACQGHNVSEDGSKVNPIRSTTATTGAFSTSRAISACWAMVPASKFRNLRVLDMGAGCK